MFVGIDATLLKGQQAFHLAASSNESGGIVFYKTCYHKKVFLISAKKFMPIFRLDKIDEK